MCDEGHESYRWTSSAMMTNGVFLNNFQALSAVVVSGNNFSKIALFARFFGLAFPGKTTFHNVQAKCVVPVVDTYWKNLQQSSLEEHRAVKITVSGKLATCSGFYKCIISIHSLFLILVKLFGMFY